MLSKSLRSNIHDFVNHCTNNRIGLDISTNTIAIAFKCKRKIQTRFHRVATNDISAVTSILKNIIQQEGLVGAICNLSLPVQLSKLKTITLPRIKLRDLKSMLRQTFFWQEYLGITMTEYRVAYKHLVTKNVYETSLLLAAVPIETIRQISEMVKAAQLKLHVIDLSCFDTFSDVYSLYKNPHVVTGSLLLAEDDAYLIRIDNTGVQLQLLDRNEALSKTKTLADAIEHMFNSTTQHEREMQLRIFTESENQYSYLSSFANCLAAQLDTHVMSIQKYADIDVSASCAEARAALRLKNNQHIFNFATNDIQSKHVIKARMQIAVMASAIVLGATGFYVHWYLISHHDALLQKFNQYKQLLLTHDQYVRERNVLEELWRNQQSLLLDARNAMQSQKQTSYLLDIIENTVPDGIWLSKTEFQNISFSIWGKGIAEETILDYAETLRKTDAIEEVWLQSLITEDNLKFKTFVMKCWLSDVNQSLEL